MLINVFNVNLTLNTLITFNNMPIKADLEQFKSKTNLFIIEFSI